MLFCAILILTSHPGNPSTCDDSVKLGVTASLLTTKRLQAANRIVDLMMKRNELTLPPIPVITYALSLAMTIFYWEFRINPDDARTRWMECCTILKSLGPVWWLAESMSSLGEIVLERLETSPPSREESVSEVDKPSNSEEQIADALDSNYFYDFEDLFDGKCIHRVIFSKNQTDH